MLNIYLIYNLILEEINNKLLKEYRIKVEYYNIFMNK